MTHHCQAVVNEGEKKKFYYRGLSTCRHMQLNARARTRSHTPRVTAYTECESGCGCVCAHSLSLSRRFLTQIKMAPYSLPSLTGLVTVWFHLQAQEGSVFLCVSVCVCVCRWGSWGVCNVWLEWLPSEYPLIWVYHQQKLMLMEAAVWVTRGDCWKRTHTHTLQGW